MAEPGAPAEYPVISGATYARGACTHITCMNRPVHHSQVLVQSDAGGGLACVNCWYSGGEGLPKSKGFTAASSEFPNCALTASARPASFQAPPAVSSTAPGERPLWTRLAS